MAELITPLVRRRIALLGLPVWFLVAVTRHLHETGATEPHNLDGVEFFAGVKTWSGELQKRGLNVYSFEILDDKIHGDFLGDLGFINALGVILRCKPGAILHWATVCSSWVTINRGTSGRGVSNPLGNVDRLYVRDANTMVSRMCLCILFGVCLNLDWILEQPLSSIMTSHPRFQVLLNMSELGAIKHIMEVHTWMGSFGGFSPKPTMLVGTPVWLSRLARTLPWADRARFKNTELTEYYFNSAGTKKFHGRSLVQTKVQPTPKPIRFDSRSQHV
jgi:hypothetical protein